MIHINPISRVPRRAQTPDISLAALFSLVANILAVVATAVIAKENSQFPTTPPAA